MIVEGGNETALKNKLAQTLALIELQCDAFAALTLAYLNYTPLAFIEGFERIGRDFPSHRVGFHPLDVVRRKLVEQIIPKIISTANAKPSLALKELKRILSSNGAVQ